MDSVEDGREAQPTHSNEEDDNNSQMNGEQLDAEMRLPKENGAGAIQLDAPPRPVSAFRPRVTLKTPGIVETAQQLGRPIDLTAWSALELNLLLEGIKWYGTSEGSVTTIHRKYFADGVRRREDIKAKIDEIRSLNAESRRVRESLEKYEWSQTKRTAKKTDLFHWSSAVNRMALKRKSTAQLMKTMEPHKAVKNVITSLYPSGLPSRLYNVTRPKQKKTCPKGAGQQAIISWQNLYDQLGTWIVSGDFNKKMGPLENAILLKMYDELVSEAMNVSEDKKKELQGLFDMLMQNDYRNFVPHGGFSMDKAKRVLLDPLRARDPIDEEREESADNEMNEDEEMEFREKMVKWEKKPAVGTGVNRKLNGNGLPANDGKALAGTGELVGNEQEELEEETGSEPASQQTDEVGGGEEAQVGSQKTMRGRGKKEQVKKVAPVGVQKITSGRSGKKK